jgi:hypothetical protein
VAGHRGVTGVVAVAPLERVSVGQYPFLSEALFEYAPIASTTKSQVRAFRAVSRQHSRQHRTYSACIATVWLRTRKDRSPYTSVLFRLDGKQSSMCFDDHAKAVRFKDLVNQVGPANFHNVSRGRVPSRNCATLSATTR